MSKSLCYFFGLFLLVLLYFFSFNGWYENDQLIIKGHGVAGGVLDLKWDSGAGFNGYENRRFSFTTAPGNVQRLPLKIRFIADNNSASLSSTVVCSRIRVDSKSIDLSGLVDKDGGYQVGTGVVLNENYGEIKLSVPAVSSVEIELLTNNHSGKVEITVGTDTIVKDLYIANEAAKHGLFQYWLIGEKGDFEVYVDLPRYPVKRFKLESVDRKKNVVVSAVELRSKSTKELVPLFDVENGSVVNFDLQEVRAKHYFDPIQFAFQFCFALLSAWIIFTFFNIFQSSGGIKGVFAGDRKIFWFFTLGAVVAFGFWLIVFWPGVMSVDSLKIWRAAVLPEVFSNDHPVLNIVLYMYLAQIWQNPAVVPIFHICMMSILTGYIFFSVYRQGVRFKYLLPFYALLVFSIPVGLYNIVLWKDIPFAMLVVFWAFTLADLYRKKLEGDYYLSLQKKVVLVLLLLALALTRHNGIIYLGVIPIFFALLGLVPLKKFVFVCATIIFGMFCFLLILQMSGRIADFNYFSIQAGGYLKNIFDASPVQLLTRTFENYWGILNINQTLSKWDLWHFFLADRQAYSFLTHAGWNDVYSYLPGSHSFLVSLRELCMQTYWKTYEIPWVYITWNPLYILVLLPLSVLFFKKVPLTAIFSAIILIQVLALVLINVFNWRYYYFVCVAGFFLGPLLLLDLKRKGNGRLARP